MDKLYAVVCGSLNMDFVCTAPYIPRPGETVLGYEFVAKEGGKGANQAAAIAKLGMKTFMIGCVGEDPFGQALLDSLIKNGVNTEYVTVVPYATGTAHITVGNSGENNIVVIPSANAALSPDVVCAAQKVLESAAVAVAQLEIPMETVKKFMSLAKKRGIMCVLDPAPMEPTVFIYTHIPGYIDCGQRWLFESRLRIWTDFFAQIPQGNRAFFKLSGHSIKSLRQFGIIRVFVIHQRQNLSA